MILEEASNKELELQTKYEYKKDNKTYKEYNYEH